MDRYIGLDDPLNVVGRGSYGVVYRVRDRRTGRLCAVKRMVPDPRDAAYERRCGIPHTLIREVSLLRELRRHDNIVALLDCLLDGSGSLRVLLVFEYVESDLFRYMNDGGTEFDGNGDGAGRRPPPLAEDPETVRSLMFQLCRGIAHLHSNGIIHRGRWVA